MKSMAKATIVAALITAVASISVALIPGFGNSSEDLQTDKVTPTVACPEIPPVQRINVTQPEGMVWVQADWDWVGDQFEPMPGHWEKERTDYGNYIPGHWDTSNGNCAWIPGAFEGQVHQPRFDSNDFRTPSPP